MIMTTTEAILNYVAKKHRTFLRKDLLADTCVPAFCTFDTIAHADNSIKVVELKRTVDRRRWLSEKENHLFCIIIYFFRTFETLSRR